MNKNGSSARRAMKELFLEEASEELTPDVKRNEVQRNTVPARIMPKRNATHPEFVRHAAKASPMNQTSAGRNTDTVKKTTHHSKLFAAPTAFDKYISVRLKTFVKQHKADKAVKAKSVIHKANSAHISKKNVRRMLIVAGAIAVIAAAVTCTALFVNGHDFSDDIPDIQLGANISLDSDSLLKIAEAMKDGDAAAVAKFAEIASHDEKAAETDTDGDIIVEGEALPMLAARGMNSAASNGRYSVTINFYQKDSIILTTDSVTYSELFAKAGVTIGESERIYVEPSDYITADAVIAVDTVEYRTISGTEPIPFETVYEDVRTVPRGTTSQKRAGVNGTKQIDYYCEFVNGVENTRTEVSQTVVENPTSRIMYRGIGGTINGHSYSYYIDVKATTYTGGGTTASGLPATENVIAVDPRVIKLGTKCYVAGSYGDFGVRIAADTGGSIKGNLIDIYLDQSNPYFGGFGWKSMRVYILG